MIVFNGVDVVVARDVDDSSVRRVLGAALGVPEDRIVVIADVSQYPPRDSADVVVVASQVGGHFARILSIQSAQRTLDYDNELGPLQRFCDELDTRCLVPDDSVNPYSVWLLARGETPRRVGLVPEDADEDRFVLLEREVMLRKEAGVLNNVLRNFCNVNGFDRGWSDDIRRFLKQDPQREAQFKIELDAAIEHGALSAVEYEELTDEDFDTDEDLVEWLKELRNRIFPG
jgi:hypothetical protein